MRKTLLALAAILSWVPNTVLAFPPGAISLDGLSYLVQWGSTPDTVQDQLDPSLVPNTSADAQHMSIWLSSGPEDMFTPDMEEKSVETIYQGVFASSPYESAVIVELLNDADANNRVSVLAAACGDPSCSNALFGYAVNAYPLDGKGNWHNLQVFINPLDGTISLQIDTQDTQVDSSLYWSGAPFQIPIVGDYWYVGCSSGLWEGDCLTADVAELWVYSGPQTPTTIDVAAGAFWYTSGGFIRANSLDASSGTAVWGDYPTIYLRRGPAAFADGNAYNFSFLPNPPVLPWYVGTIVSDEGNFGGAGLIDAPTTPY